MTAAPGWAERRFFWVLPGVIASGVAALVGWLLTPIWIRTLQTHPPLGLTPDLIEPVLETLRLVIEGIAILSPVFWLLKIWGLAWLLGLVSKAMGLRTRFLALFNLLALCSLIQTLETIAGYVIIRAEAPRMVSLDQMEPAAGFDLLLPAGTNAFLSSTLHFFSVFEIAYIAAITIGLAKLTGCSRGKAFAAVIAVWLPSLVMTWLGAAIG